jgi:beta-lactam-binding protein with PASTA domain
MSTDTLLANRYQIVDMIGEGGMAMVYRARDIRTGHYVAIKFLRPEYKQSPEFLARFQREATAASKMSHHNIVNLLDVGSDDENPYIVIEYVDGKTLKDIISERKKLPEDLAAQIAIRILSALQHAHTAGIIHRDIKPQNILVDQKGYIKVSDFGIARMVGVRTATMDDAGSAIMGSVHYFSPEQARGETATAASDLYSVGVTLYEMLTGSVPFEGDTAVAIAMQHVQVKPVPVRERAEEVSPAIENVVMKALEKDPMNRFHSALEMARALRTALQFPEKENTQDVPLLPDVQAARPAQPPARRKAMKRTRMLVVLLAILVIAGLAVGAFLIYNGVVSTTYAPYLLGETEQEAIRMARNAGLDPQVVRQSDKSEAGTVILQSHDFGFAMKRGDVILITVSSGPLQHAAPAIVDKPQDEALRSVEQLGLKLLITDRVLDVAPAGTIISQDPEAGTMMDYGGIIQAVVSGGKVTVPSVKGMTRAQALQTLQAAGLTTERVDELPIEDPLQVDQVADQLPEADTVVMAQTEVTLVVYVAMPSSESPAPTGTEGS